MPPERIVVNRCNDGVLGSFDSPNLTICYNNYQHRPTVLRNTIVHELVHAYDFCRSKDIDFFNCRHLACTEVRTLGGAPLSSMQRWPRTSGSSSMYQSNMRMCGAVSVYVPAFAAVCESEHFGRLQGCHQSHFKHREAPAHCRSELRV